MLSSLPRWRTGLTGTFLAGVLAACGTTPGDLPNRTGFPGRSDAPSATASPAEVEAYLPAVTGERLNDELFAATRAALADGDWMAATLALAAIETPDPENAEEADTAASEDLVVTALWIDYYKARIAYLRGDTGEYSAIVTELEAQPLPDALRRAVLELQLDVAQRQGNDAAQLQLALRLLSQGAQGAPPPSRLLGAVWNAAQRLQKDKNPAPSYDTITQGWLDLATATTVDSPLATAAALGAWSTQYPQHAGRTYADALREAALEDAKSNKLTLVLPLSGPLEKAGAAVSEGFIAGFFAEQQPGLTVDVLDSRRFETIGAAYAEAQAQGASVIVGPLGKRQVAELLAETELKVPVLALNRPLYGGDNNPRSLLLSLAPEDEARQLADNAFADGARRALVIRPEGEWGERMELALARRWQALGGQIPTTAIYGTPDSHSPALRDALGLGESGARSLAVRALFNEPVEIAGRRREDLDTVFLLSKSSDEARALKPLVNYHYAGDLPVYALSTADSGSGSSGLNRDLGGLNVLAMPWRLDPASVNADGGSVALHALGMDAYALAKRWWRMRSVATPLYFGLTAELRSDDDGRLERRLNMAEFDRGELRPR
ncbi:penicillin-binding protein activator [Congregibacter litoralis]|uniref:Putative lipoprotein n=1 Tax=Congregibacter litoralis KT71 TaxID=314285 RepID=A4A5E9_9GAMM|nr:penicillin-binding protein activator [Congregibacter litoralis]EAQ99020.1 putative lipoprotein [Congregibacter litoralis KT71]